MLPTLPNDVSLLIARATGPLWSLGRLMRVSRAWRATLAAYVARLTDSATFYIRLRSRMVSCLNDCYPEDTAAFESVSLRNLLLEESVPRFASLALLLERYEFAWAARPRLGLHAWNPLAHRMNDAFVSVFTKRGVMRTFITLLRHDTHIRKLENRRSDAVDLVERKRSALAKSEAALEAADKRKDELVEKKRRKLEELGVKMA